MNNGHTVCQGSSVLIGQPVVPASVDVVLANRSPEETFASVAGSGSVMFTGGAVTADGAPGSDDGRVQTVGRVAVAAGR